MMALDFIWSKINDVTRGPSGCLWNSSLLATTTRLRALMMALDLCTEDILLISDSVRRITILQMDRRWFMYWGNPWVQFRYHTRKEPPNHLVTQLQLYSVLQLLSQCRLLILAIVC